MSDDSREEKRGERREKSRDSASGNIDSNNKDVRTKSDTQRHYSDAKNNGRDRDERRRSRDRDRGYGRDGDRYSDVSRHRDSSRRSSRSPPRRHSRDRIRERDRRDKRRSKSRSRSRSRSLSPLSRRIKARRLAEAAKAKEAPSQRFWDGFQWVERSTQPIVSGLQPPSGAPPVCIGNQKERRVYVGNLPPSTTPEQLKEFMNAAMVACGGVPAGVSSAVLSVWMGPENKYSFVEMCSAETATVALGLSGISYMGTALKLARPKTYSDSTSMAGVMAVAPGALFGLAGGMMMGPP